LFVEGNDFVCLMNNNETAEAGSTGANAEINATPRNVEEVNAS